MSIEPRIDVKKWKAEHNIDNKLLICIFIGNETLSADAESYIRDNYGELTINQLLDSFKTKGGTVKNYEEFDKKI